MKKIVLCIAALFTMTSVVFAADSAGNRKDQMLRLGMKSGLHLMYLVSSPFVLVKIIKISKFQNLLYYFSFILNCFNSGL